MSRTSGVVRLDYAWVRQHGGLAMVGSSPMKTGKRQQWDAWLSGLQCIPRSAGICHPVTVRCYIADENHAAIINREYRGEDARHDTVSVLAGSVEDLSAQLSLQLHPWPSPVQSPHHPWEADRYGVWPLAHPALTRAARGAGSSALPLCKIPPSGHIIDISSPVERLGTVRLVEPLAATLAGVLEHLHRALAWQKRFRLVLVGADEPTARNLVAALVDILGTAAPDSRWPTFSTFETEYPGTTATDLYPNLVFMPEFQHPAPEFDHPTAYVFLAPALRPANPQLREFAAPAASGDGAAERAAQVLVAAYREGGLTRTTEALSGTRNLGTLDFEEPAAFDGWVEDLETWASGERARYRRNRRIPSQNHPSNHRISPPTPTGKTAAASRPPVTEPVERSRASGEHNRIVYGYSVDGHRGVTQVPGRAGGEPAAFLSYTHADDDNDDGLITAFRQRLERALRAQTGRRDLQIFQDRDNIAWGQAWKDRIDHSLDTVTFLIPIVTPAFLASEQCRRELIRFLDRERRLGRSDLILPVYWISVRVLEIPGRATGDEVAETLASRHYADWRDLRFEPLESPACRRAMAALAAQVHSALDPETEPAGPAPVSTTPSQENTAGNLGQAVDTTSPKGVAPTEEA